MVLKWNEFDLEAFKAIPCQVRKKGNKGHKGKQPLYKDVVAAFDIETTRIPEINQAVMYIWQFQIGLEWTIVGRTWSEFLNFIRSLNAVMEMEDTTLCVFVHNLGHEFEYISGIMEFAPEDVFAVSDRKILKATYQHVEFRCSYLQTNMSLRAFLEKMHVKSYKLKMNYNKLRFWYTPLTDKELAYCINDVRGLVQGIMAEMERDGDTLASLPLTSTGYARRDMKQVMSKVSHTLIASLMPSWDIYELLREAFRGGNTHGNRFYVDRIISAERYHSNIFTSDASSMYPFQIVDKPFPMSRFYIKEGCTYEDLEDLVFKREKAVLCRCSLRNVRLRDPTWPVPYLPVSKCKGIHNSLNDNGRIISADWIEQVTFTDLDLKIMSEEYEFELEPITVAYARYGMLPEGFRKLVHKYYCDKTDLKDKPTDEEHTAEFYEMLYGKLKNLLNALYGMLAQDPVKVSIKFVNEVESLFAPDESETKEDILLKHNKKSVICYQWGCWVTAWARFWLESAIRLVHETDGAEFLYCDTDSCKYIGTVDWDKLNKPVMERAKKNNLYATDPNGKQHFMGVFENEKKSEAIEFKTMGAKKYAYRTLDGKLHITIAGVNKKIGAVELEKAGGLPAMQQKFQFQHAGGLEVKYNDFPALDGLDTWTTKEGVTIKITRNVCLVPTTKTLGITDEFKELIDSCQSIPMDL